MSDPKQTHVRGPGFLEKRFSIEEDGLLWLHACYGRGVDAFNAEDMLRAYEAGRAHPNMSVMQCGWPACVSMVDRETLAETLFDTGWPLIAGKWRETLWHDRGIAYKMADAVRALFQRKRVSREGEAGSRSATEPDANLAGPEGDARPDHFNVHMHDWHGEADGIGYSCSSCSASMTESGQISRPRWEGIGHCPRCIPGYPCDEHRMGL